jgi:YegS/Rv2252/BmrU family lipid kinase
VIRALVVGRERPGREIPEVVAEVGERLREAGWEIDTAVVKRKRDVRRATRRALKDDRDVVVAVGGDGAVLQVATVLADTKVALGIIPTGTGNLLAANLKVPTDRDQAVETVLTGRPRRIDTGRLTMDGKKRAFTVACGIGYDAKVMDATEPESKMRWGKLAYLANALGQAGSLHNSPHEITLDGRCQTMEAAQVFIANFGKMLPVAQPRRKIRGDDGLLDVIVIRAAGPIPALLAGWEALMQKDLGESAGGHVFRAQARKIRVRSDPERLVETDGSVAGKTPIHAAVRPRSLTVIVPKR